MADSLAVTAYTIQNALGAGRDASLQALRENRGGLRPCDLPNVGLTTWIGRVEGVEQAPLPDELSVWECRNNRLAWMALQLDGFRGHIDDVIGRYGAHRIGLFLGTSTSGIASTEAAYAEMDQQEGHLPNGFSIDYTHNIFSLVGMVREALKLRGPALSISTACSSSAKVFAAAWRYIQAGLCEAAVVGGVDSLCLTTLYGFNSLELVSNEPCRPWDSERRGISIGEAAGFVLLEPAPTGRPGCRLLGYGESSDAYHMSTPRPDGIGAAEAMGKALRHARLNAADVDYINLHGTATPSNDDAEDKAVLAVFGNETPCSSTKGWIGHTLGAAGICEAIFSLIFLEEGFVAPSLNTRQIDDKLHAGILLERSDQAPRRVLSNSFGFGGNNCSLLFGID